ncbi:MAG TPA: hydroxymethylbilane synthase [Capsulimonadaceae bacterium]|jgi:hydroxymethylbilane synthase
MTKSIRIGTRGSALARVQTDWVAERLREAHPGIEITIETFVTHGDKTQAANVPLASFGEKGIFAKELEAALLADEIDVAVHSMKDLAAELPDGLHIAAIPVREDPRDAVVGVSLAELPDGARVGTGSVRRVALLKAMWPKLVATEIRGNVDTRIRKLREGQYDSIILAAAGLIRLGLDHEIKELFDPVAFVPDPGQGALAIQSRTADTRVNELLAPLNHPETRTAVLAERAYLAALGGGCHTPVGAWAWVDGGTVTLRVMVTRDNGDIRRATVVGSVSAAEALGRRAAKEIRH